MIRPVRRCLWLLWLPALASASDVPVEAVVSTKDATVVVHTAAPGGLKVVGRSTGLVVQTVGEKVVMRLSVASLDTGIGLRNKHLHEAMEAALHPTAELTVLRRDIELKPGGTEVPATLNVHGQSKEVRVRYKATPDAPDHFRVEGDFTLDMRDFGITPPRYLGVSVKPDVRVEAQFSVPVPKT